MNSFTFDKTNLACGALLVATGAFFAVQSLSMEIGSTFRMGPGFFPLALSAVLIVLGVVVLIQATRVEGEPLGAIAWRGMAFILPAPIIFGLTVRSLGFVPAIFITALIASFASHKMSMVAAVVLSACVAAFSYTVFLWGLGLPYQAFAPWLGL
ncbi:MULTISPECIES: tripartite tricarboxylate transporter TctB family protein [Mesorhizobium]|uniref:Tripartite tricarboxylate transporter TctB family protein n=1 Tax=Mesorhizobium denitrificans TaxID=2294114 RepID=A0A371XBP7_9HYPH|nr:MULTISPECIES: tripartite tricarboxylate transporter TctB family protein [Mesorhizobium]RFC66646.1 tripartite tricarboxylate transporter TctB family protein [Mesorhizobium denitrificans]